MIRDRDNAPLVIMISGTNTFRGTLRILRNGTIEKRETMPIFLSFECKFIFLKLISTNENKLITRRKRLKVKYR